VESVQPRSQPRSSALLAKYPWTGQVQAAGITA
jgi:hypothetical protein